MDFNNSMSGYKKLKNTKGYTNQDLLSVLRGVEFPFGTPELSTLAKKETICFTPEIGRFVVYLRADKKNIEMGTAAAPGKAGKIVLKELGMTLLTDAQAEDTAKAQRAVDELYDVIKGFVENGSVSYQSSQDDGVELYMKQKILAIKDKFDICDEAENSVYWVEGNLISLKYQMTDANGQDILEIRKKMVAIMPEFSIFVGGQKVAELKKKMKLTRPEIVGKVNGEDLQIKGDLTGYHFSIALGGQVVGSVDTKRLTWGDVYAIGIRDTAKTELIVAIAVIIDNMLRGKN